MEKHWKVGKEFEDMASIIIKCGVKSKQAVNVRVRYLRGQGVEITPHYYAQRKVYWTRKDADKIINVKFTRKKRSNK